MCLLGKQDLSYSVLDEIENSLQNSAVISLSARALSVAYVRFFQSRDVTARFKMSTTQKVSFKNSLPKTRSAIHQ